jgi:trimeric autotransporter adhesin
MMNMKTLLKFSLILSGTFLVASCAKQSDPVITLNGDEEMTIYIGDTWTDPGATAVDYKGRDISADIEVSGTVPATSGHTTLDYTVSDKKGNFAVEQRGVSRGFRNTDIAGTYMVDQYTSNGGGAQTYSATVTAGTGNSVDITLDQSNSIFAPVVIQATISGTGRQIVIADQSDSGCSISLGEYGNDIDNTTGAVIFDLNYQTFCGSITYDHTATWTKQ